MGGRGPQRDGVCWGSVVHIHFLEGQGQHLLHHLLTVLLAIVFDYLPWHKVKEQVIFVYLSAFGQIS